MILSLIFVVFTIGLSYWAFHRTRLHEASSRVALEESVAEGLHEPPSLHPIIDDSLCIGCAACVAACPEKQILGIVEGKARLIGASQCVGHGACRTACPTMAITLVFGTSTRGVDIPLVSPNFETNVPGIFIAGELGGMGLIGNAFEQGRQAIESIKGLDQIGSHPALDTIIVGAGPAGIAASLAAKEQGLRSVTLEQGTLGGAIFHYPRGKVVMTRPGQLPLAGKVKFTETTKEELLEFLQKVEREHRPNIRYEERVETIEKDEGGFVVQTNKGSYSSQSVLLAIGRRGTPRRLDVPGESRSKVVYSLIDPDGYRGKRLLVVGGGDSALEAATSLADVPGTTVTLSYRSPSFSRARAANRDRVAAAEERRQLRVLLNSNVTEIAEEHVVIQRDGDSLKIPNDDVIICAGGILPTKFLQSVGVQIETKFGEA